MKDRRKSAKRPVLWITFVAMLCCIALTACTRTKPDEIGKEELTPPPAQSVLPTPAPPPSLPEIDAGVVPDDPETFLLGFADAEIVSIYDEFSREYAAPDKSFAEIISAETWTAHAFPEFPASIAERLIIMRNGDWELRIEDDGEDCLYAAYAVGRSASDLIIYFDCGENLMDELMSWAIARQAGTL